MVIKTNFSYKIFVHQLFLKLQVLSWELNASVLIQGDTDAIDLKYPAITICPKVSTKYGIAERLGNYIDPNNLPDKAMLLKREMFKCSLDSPSDIDKNYADIDFVENDPTSSGCGKIQHLSGLSLIFLSSRRFLKTIYIFRLIPSTYLPPFRKYSDLTNRFFPKIIFQ